MPNNTGVAIYIGALTFVLGFALTWRVWWLCLLSLVAIIVLMIVRSWRGDPGYIITAAELEKMEREAMQRQQQVEGHLPHHGGQAVPGGAMAYEGQKVSPLGTPPSSGGDHH